MQLRARCQAHPLPSQRAPDFRRSALVVQPAGGVSLLDASTWGHLFCANELERKSLDPPGIQPVSLVAHLLVFLEHARYFYAEIGYDGNLEACLTVNGVRGLPWVYFTSGCPAYGPASRPDSHAAMTLALSTQRLQVTRDSVVTDRFRAIACALNWADVASQTSSLEAFLARGYEYNGWPPPRGP